MKVLRAMAAVAVAALLAPATGADAQPGTTTCREPRSAPTDVGTQDNWISALAHLSTCSVWVVGYWSDGAGPNGDQKYVAHALAEHWNGRSWRLVALPTVGAPDDNVILLGISGVTGYDIWAVGRHNDNVNDDTVALHWDGHTWSHVATPRVALESELTDVAAHTHNDAWAVGTWDDTRQKGALIEHWNGRRWVVQSKRVGVALSDVATTRAGHTWTVGTITRHGKSYGLILHWTGSRWVSQAGALLPAGSDLLAVAARGSNDVWAVGQRDNTSRNLALHYSGGRWRRVPVPQFAADTNALDAVAPAADGSVWATAFDETNGAGRSHVLVRRNGSWHKLGCTPETPNHLGGIAAARPGEAFAAGFTTGSGGASHLLAVLCR